MGIKIGSNLATTNYSEVEADGTIVCYGDAIAWEDKVVTLLTRTGTGSPTYASGFGGNANLYYWSYSGTGSTVNNQYAEVQMPHSWDGGNVYMHFHWCPTTTATGTVVWNVEYSWANIGSTFDTGPGSIASDTHVIASSELWKHNMTSVAVTTPSASQNGISSILVMRIFRDAGADTYNAPVALIGFDIHYGVNTMGSRTPTSK